MLIGYHTDWADQFPFQQIGLEDNYAEPPPSVFIFGFDYDPAYVEATGTRLLPGLLQAETQLRAKAARLNIPVDRYRAALRTNYQEIAAAAQTRNAAKEIAHDP